MSRLPRTGGESLNKGKIAGIVALAMLLVSLVGVQQGYAREGAPVLAPHVSQAVIESVSNPSGGCLNLGLDGSYGTVEISPYGLLIYLQHASPSSTYTVSYAYAQTGGACDGTWHSVGSVSTDGLGSGTLGQGLSLASGSYMFEFKDSAGTTVYATDALTL